MTTVMTPKSAAEAVAQGAQLLDEKHPGWHQKIDLDLLDVGCGCTCICGQLARHDDIHDEDEELWTVWAKRELDINLPEAGKYGFTYFLDLDGFNYMLGWPYSELDREWTLAIKARRKADKLASKPTKTKKKEMVPA